MKTLNLFRLCSLAAFLLALANAPALAAELPRIDLEIRGQKLVAEVAASEATRETGLMKRFSLAKDHGMLFVFPGMQGVAMWMKNTYIPLSVAFMDAEGRILNIADMQPQTENVHPSSGLALYALEMRLGWFREHGIGPGDKVGGLAAAGKAKD
jgi:uncharacterized membrane protein (UPF0127 family)